MDLGLMAIPAALGVLNFIGQERTNDANVQLGQQQMDFQERMSSTSYQRAVSDMQAAGLNPMLAYSQGGASSPMGSMPQIQNSMSAGTASANQAMGIMQGAAQLSQTAAQTELTKYQALKERENVIAARYDALYKELDFKHKAQDDSDEFRLPVGNYFGATAKQARELAARTEAEKRLKQLDIPRAQNEMKFEKDLGEANPYLKQFLLFIRGLTGAVNIGR